MRFRNINDMEEYLECVEEEQIFQECDINEVKCKGLINAPILVPEIRDKHHVDSGIDDDVLISEMNGTKLMLEFPTPNKEHVLPLAGTALSHVFQRAGLGEPSVLMATKDRSTANELSPEDRATIANMCLRAQKGKAKVLVRNGKVRAIHSSLYAYISPTEIIKTAYDELGKLGETFFEEGEFTQEIEMARFYVNCEDIKNEAERVFITFNVPVDVSNYDLNIEIVTSDVGMSAVTVLPMLKNKSKYILIGEPLRVEHENGAGISDVRKILSQIYSSCNEFNRKLEELGRQKIENAGALFYIGEKIGFGRRALVEKMQELSSEYEYDGEFRCDGSVIFTKLYELLEETSEERRAKGKPVGSMESVKLMEAISRYCFTSLKEYDIPYVNSGK